MSPAHELLAARARRRSLIRHRIVAAVLATFALAWGAVVWDGSMGEATTTAQAKTATTTTDDDTTAATDESTTTDESSDDASTSTPDTLTTSQS